MGDISTVSGQITGGDEFSGLLVSPTQGNAAGEQYGARINNAGVSGGSGMSSFIPLAFHGGALNNYKSTIWISPDLNRPGINSGFVVTVVPPDFGAVFAGNIGILNSSPQAALHAGAGADAPSTPNTVIYASKSGQTGLAVRDSSNNIELGMIAGTTLASLGTVTNHSLQILINNTERMRITTGGFVGIGTTAPITPLHIEQDGVNNYILLGAYGSGFDSKLLLYTANGTQAAPTATQMGDVIGSVYFQGYDTARSTGARIYGIAPANWGTAGDTTDNPTDIRFATTPDGAGLLSDRMVIDSDGMVAIGLQVGVATAIYDLEVIKDAPNATLFLGGFSSTGLGGCGTVRLFGARGSYLSSPAANQAGDRFGEIDFMGWDGNGRTIGGAIYAQAAAAWGSSGDTSDAPTDLYFATAADGSETVVDRMVVKSTGKVRIGATQHTDDALMHIGAGANSPVYLGSYPLLYLADEGVAKIQITSGELGDYAMLEMYADGAAGTTTIGTLYPHPLIVIANDHEIARFEYSGDPETEKLIVHEDLHVNNQVYIYAGHDDITPADFEDARSLNFAKEDQHIAWRSEFTGESKTIIGWDGVDILEGGDYHITSGIVDMLKLKDDEKFMSVFLGGETPEGTLHVSNWLPGSGPQAGGWVTKAITMSGSGGYALLTGGADSSSVQYAFIGHAVVRRLSGGGVIAVTLNVADGSPQVVTTDTGNSVTFSVSSFSLIVTRSAGSGSFDVAISGLFM